VRSTRYYAISVFAAASGCRRGELLALRWPDINPQTGVVTIAKSVSQTKEGLEIKVTKTRKTQFVRVDETTLHVLMEHRTQIQQEKRLLDRITTTMTSCSRPRMAITACRAR
jgi:integrase